MKFWHFAVFLINFYQHLGAQHPNAGWNIQYLIALGDLYGEIPVQYCTPDNIFPAVIP